MKQLLGYERFSSEAKITYVRLNIPAPCPPRSVVPVHQERGFASLFHQHAGSLSARDATTESEIALQVLGQRGATPVGTNKAISPTASIGASAKKAMSKMLVVEIHSPGQAELSWQPSAFVENWSERCV